MLLRKASVAVEPDEIGTRSSTVNGVIMRSRHRASTTPTSAPGMGSGDAKIQS
jgi:hypothetical protein